LRDIKEIFICEIMCPLISSDTKHFKVLTCHLLNWWHAVDCPAILCILTLLNTQRSNFYSVDYTACKFPLYFGRTLHYKIPLPTREAKMLNTCFVSMRMLDQYLVSQRTRDVANPCINRHWGQKPKNMVSRKKKQKHQKIGMLQMPQTSTCYRTTQL
jgi:hypothetical protein